MNDMTNRAYHHGDLKAALLTAARSIVEEQGADAFTLREAARRAGVSHGAPAHHFGDKTGLLTLLAAQVMDQLKACGMAHIEFLISHPHLENLCWRNKFVDRSDPALVDALERMAAELIATMSAVTGITLIPDKEANPSTLLAISVVHGFAQMVNERIILRDATEHERQEQALAMASDMLDLVGNAFGGARVQDA
jgi:AcrR family transcriptional regulator